METLKDKDPRFKGLEMKIGIMVLSALAGVVLIIIFLGIERDLFLKKYFVYIVTDSGSGFVKGMPVRLSGFKIGRVKNFELIEGAKVQVTVEINRKHQKWLREGSMASLAKEGYIGDSYVEITVGPPDARVLDEGDLIPFERKGGVEELINEAKPVLNEIKEIIHYVNDPEGDFKSMVSNMNEISAGLKDTKSKLHTTINEGRVVVKKMDMFADKLNAKAVPALESAGRAFEKIEGLSDDAAEAVSMLPGAARKVDGIVDDVKGLTDTLSEETPRLREILINADKSMRDGRQVMKGVKESWPVRLMLPPQRKPGLVPLDSFLFNEGDLPEREGDALR